MTQIKDLSKDWKKLKINQIYLQIEDVFRYFKSKQANKIIRMENI